MRKVFTISLNGNAYQLEEAGYEALQAYLETAQAKLGTDPDRAEILADLEQAIAEKCSRFLGAHKNVLTAEEIQQTLSEMGPVDGPPESGSAEASPQSEATGAQGRTTSSDTAAPKRLYQIREGAMISGVCKGLAAYFNVDVSIVRLIFVALAILTWGAWIIAYIVMMFVIPYASTSEERAAAHGLPFDAQHLVEQAKQQYASFKNGAHWRRHWRRQARAQRREWRREWRQGRHAPGDSMYWGPPHPQFENAGYAARVLAGVMIPIAAIGTAVLGVAFVIAVVQLVTSGTLFGWMPPAGVPLWAIILILAVVFHICVSPLRATRHAAIHAYGPVASVWFALCGGLMWLVFLVAVSWLAWRYWPDVQHFIHGLAESLRGHRDPRFEDSIRWSLTGQLSGLAACAAVAAPARLFSRTRSASTDRSP